MSDWIDKHSVNCYFCGKLVDERDCIPADEWNDNDGGDACPDCIKLKTEDTEECPETSCPNHEDCHSGDPDITKGC